MINDRTILSVILALLILFLFRLSSISNSSCPPTRFIATGNVSQNYQEIIADLIQQYDGLPKTSGDLSRMGRGQIYSVAEWHIIHSHVTRGFSLWHDLFDDDPTYGIDADIQVRYDDGTNQTLHWESWRYGLVVCPFVFALGDGPPGRIEVVTQ